MSKHWSGLSYLDALRPAPGWVVDRAFLATYSADLVAVVAALLALAGLDDDRGSGSKVDFANAYEQLRGKIHILAQAGQIACPGRNMPVLAILDRFLTEISQAPGIWHPKLALVRFLPSNPQTPGAEPSALWRLWIGSRNLTRSLDWDAGMVLASDSNGVEIPGIADLGAELAHRAGLEATLALQYQQELERTRWKSPRGVEVRELRLLTPQSAPGFPQHPDGAKKLVVISPFLDPQAVRWFGRWGNAGTMRTLLSTRAELARLHIEAGRLLSGYTQLLALDAPEVEDVSLWLADDTAEADSLSEDGELAARGLHAKLIYAEHNAGRTLWLGSANATFAAWNGRNTEVVARLDITLDEVAEGLKEFVGMAQWVDPLSLASAEELPEEDPLEEAHHQVVERWNVIQRRSPSGPVLVCDPPPHPDNPGIALEVGLLACDLVPWPRGQGELQLPPVAPAQETELLQVRLCLGEHRRAWLQRAPLQPPPDEARDHRALARYLDPRTFLLWIRSLLHTVELGDGGGDWDSRPASGDGCQPATGPYSFAPTLEEMLQAWSRNPANLVAADRQVQRYLQYIYERGDSPITSEDRRILDEFEITWQLLRRTLLMETR